MLRANCIVQSAIPAMVLGVGMLASTTASAADRPRTNYQNMGANCHAANAYDDYVLMQRNALGYRNTSNSNHSGNNAIIVCNFMADILAVGNPVNTNHTVEAVVLYARAWRNRTVNVSCTATAGYATSPDNITITKSIPVTGDGVQRYVEFSSADNGGKFLLSPVNVVCSVPGGVELNDAAVFYYDNVGS